MKTLNTVITVSATIGVFVVAGAIGNDDVMVMSHVVHPLKETLLTILFGAGMIAPAFLRSVYGKKFS